MTADDWSDERRETAYEEASAVLEEQYDTMKDIDEKRARDIARNQLSGRLLDT